MLSRTWYIVSANLSVIGILRVRYSRLCDAYVFLRVRQWKHIKQLTFCRQTSRRTSCHILCSVRYMTVQHRVVEGEDEHDTSLLRLTFHANSLQWTRTYISDMSIVSTRKRWPQTMLTAINNEDQITAKPCCRYV